MEYEDKFKTRKNLRRCKKIIKGLMRGLQFPNSFCKYRWKSLNMCEPKRTTMRENHTLYLDEYEVFLVKNEYAASYDITINELDQTSMKYVIYFVD